MNHNNLSFVWNRFKKTSGMAYGKAIKYSSGGLCLQSVSGNAPAKGEVAALGRKCAEGSDAFKRVYSFPDPGKTFCLFALLYHLKLE